MDNVSHCDVLYWLVLLWNIKQSTCSSLSLHATQKAACKCANMLFRPREEILFFLLKHLVIQEFRLNTFYVMLTTLKVLSFLCYPELHITILFKTVCFNIQKCHFCNFFKYMIIHSNTWEYLCVFISTWVLRAMSFYCFWYWPPPFWYPGNFMLMWQKLINAKVGTP